MGITIINSNIEYNKSDRLDDDISFVICPVCSSEVPILAGYVDSCWSCNKRFPIYINFLNSRRISRFKYYKEK